MKTFKSLLLLCILMGLSCRVTASVYLPHSMTSSMQGLTLPTTMSQLALHRRCGDNGRYASSSNQMEQARRLIRQHRASRYTAASATAMAIPGYGIAEQVFVGGFSNFLSVYNIIITVRILLSWFPQAQGVAVLQPVYAITDPYLNLFRGIIPPLFGLDFSPILAFFLLSLLGNVTAAVGCEIPNGYHHHTKAQQQPHQLQGYYKALFGGSRSSRIHSPWSAAAAAQNF